MAMFPPGNLLDALAGMGSKALITPKKTGPYYASTPQQFIEGLKQCGMPVLTVCHSEEAVSYYPTLQLHLDHAAWNITARYGASIPATKKDAVLAQVRMLHNDVRKRCFGAFLDKLAGAMPMPFDDLVRFLEEHTTDNNDTRFSPDRNVIMFSAGNCVFRTQIASHMTAEEMAVVIAERLMEGRLMANNEPTPMYTAMLKAAKKPVSLRGIAFGSGRSGADFRTAGMMMTSLGLMNRIPPISGKRATKYALTPFGAHLLQTFAAKNKDFNRFFIAYTHGVDIMQQAKVIEADRALKVGLFDLPPEAATPPSAPINMGIGAWTPLPLGPAGTGGGLGISGIYPSTSTYVSNSGVLTGAGGGSAGSGPTTLSLEQQRAYAERLLLAKQASAMQAQLNNGMAQQSTTVDKGMLSKLAKRFV